MRYGFVLDQNRCIGCHACTVACKEEHRVPVGVFRTWVKHIEKGEFPDTSRHFGVMRCNHCDAAPCIDICPTTALYRRHDGIVDFDNGRCIGCKSCMQACPYDALYIDPNNNTAAKCNFCAHRIEADLQPACVIVCPTQAIIAGDLDVPNSDVSRIVATEKVSVRKPQKGTQPKLYYVGIEGDLLQPTRLSRQKTYAWADSRVSDSSPAEFNPASSRETYDVPHPSPWGWRIAAYLWTKSISAGVLLVMAVLIALGAHLGKSFELACPTIALAALAATIVLLVSDLKRPDRFHYLLIKPNFSSWLVLGGYILTIYGACAFAWFISVLVSGRVPNSVVYCTVGLAVATACYSAFLFAQAKGRDLWQSPMFFWHLLVQAFIAGASVLVILSPFGTPRNVMRWSSFILFGALIVSLAMVLAEIAIPAVSEDAKLAVNSLTTGRYCRHFWGLTIGAGLIVPIILMALFLFLGGHLSVLGIVAALLALAGLFSFEDHWVKAGQIVPLS